MYRSATPETRFVRSRTRPRAAPAIAIAALSASLAMAQSEPAPTVQPPQPAAATDNAAPSSADVTRVLREALLSRSAADRFVVLRSLRSLRDPTLEPLFSQLAMSGDPLLISQGILASAELRPGEGLNLLLLRKIDDAELRNAILLQGLDSSMFTPAQLSELARADDVDPWISVSATSELLRQGTPGLSLRPAILGMDNPRPHVALHSALVARRSGDAALAEQASRTIERTWRAVMAPGGESALEQLLLSLRRERLEESLGVLARMRDLAATDTGTRVTITLAMLAIAPGSPEAQRAVLDEWRLSVDPGSRTRMMLGALDAASENATLMPEALIDALCADELPLLRDAGQALLALRIECGSSAAAVAQLVTHGHAPCSRWALRSVRSWPMEKARPVREAIIRSLPENADAEARSIAATAASELGRAEPDALVELLAERVEASHQQGINAILIGALRIDDAAMAARMLEQRFDQPAASALATLLRARHTKEQPAPEALRAQVARVALGVGGLPEAQRVQAAWLALRLAQDDRAALSRLMSTVLP